MTSWYDLGDPDSDINQRFNHEMQFAFHRREEMALTARAIATYPKCQATDTNGVVVGHLKSAVPQDGKLLIGVLPQEQTPEVLAAMRKLWVWLQQDFDSALYFEMITPAENVVVNK